ncbi:hypothetical protein K432DRAFT_291187 [Lepidopterella palustris CBS 459.81]|uniref:Zn(2)-C6 fungal-type domain-containing protein n=1 Tax=Lepidopterella palustris CBS 459.81 TaxID=1314670 RepID=A0A8E2EG96_9PEZI|nr:hypothetical protein K432DRAFT_291187 [Lepidopterella palustris CBS 459.81]
MADPIDPRLQYSSSLPRTVTQSYSTTPNLQGNGSTHQPYYLPATHQHAPPASALDPALEETSPGLREASTDNENGVDGDHDGPLITPSSSAKSPGDLKRPRACDSCRGLKVRCDQDPNHPEQPCRRCAKANRQCITTPPTRKRQKKTDSRVAELERKIDALTATLHAQKSGTADRPYGPVDPSFEATPNQVQSDQRPYRAANSDWAGLQNGPPKAPTNYETSRAPDRGPNAKRRRLDNGNTDGTTIPEDMDAIHRDMTENPDITIPQDMPWGMRRGGRKGPQVDHSYINGLIDNLMGPDTAEIIFNRYVNEICPHFPAVPLAPGTTVKEIREKKPLLFLAILAGSSHGSSEQIVSQDVQRELTKLLKDQFADIIWRNGEKSLEIVQALQVGVLWYRPPLHYEQHNFYMMVNCAAVMALDLGLGRRATPNVLKLGVGPFRRCHPDSGSIEARRTFLVCYYLCMSITMVLRRPILLRWTKYMEESVDMLETSSEALPSDRVLCQHIKLAHIGEDISVQFSMDDPSVDVAISEPKVIYALKIFENELRNLQAQRPKDNVDPAIRLAEHVTNLYIHEIALHHNQSAADFQPPFPPETFAKVGKQDLVGPAHIAALGECLTATHGILDTILGVQLDTLLTLPVIFCVRAIYAIVCLMKMWVSVTSPGDMGNIISKEDLRIESYTERLVKLFNSIVSRDAQSPHGKFSFVAKRLQEKFAQIKESSLKGEMIGFCPSSSQEEQRLATTAPDIKEASKARSNPSSTTQTPLHLLSEVAMGSSGSTPTPQQPQPLQQALQALQQPQQQVPENTQTWYNAPGIGSQNPDMMTTTMSTGFDTNFDYNNFDFNISLDSDLSALFIPDGMLWNYPDTNFQGYGSNGNY